MRANTHGQIRGLERFSASERQSIGQACQTALDMFGYSVSIAVYSGRYDSIRKIDCSSKSNGENIVTIIRNGVIHTPFLRRDNQPATRAALDVDFVVKL